MLWATPALLFIIHTTMHFPNEAKQDSPKIVTVRRVTLSPTTYGKCEFGVKVSGLVLETRDLNRQSVVALDAVFTGPSGKTMKVPAFANAGATDWRIRFCASEAGQYQLRAELRVKGILVAEKECPPFEVASSKSKGFVRTGKSAPRYFAFDDGAGYFPVGQNVCFTTDVAKTIPGATVSSKVLPWKDAYSGWFKNLRENGADWARIWLRPNFTIEAGEPWEWSVENSQKIDDLVELAAKNGIYLCLCFNSERDDQGTIMGGTFEPFDASKTAWGKLFKQRGIGFQQLATDPACREMYRDKIRYIVARWGYSTHIFAWEFWNEIECVGSDGIDLWAKDMTEYLRSVDPWHHLIKSSSHAPGSSYYWGKEFGDLNDVHPYFGWAGDDETRNLGSFLPKYSTPLYDYGRPFLIGETGIAREVKTRYGLAGDLADKDLTCFHLYESLYGGLFSGSAGTGMVWWWDDNVGLKNGYSRFKAFQRFIKGIDFTVENFERDGSVHVFDPEVAALGLKGTRTSLLWVRHKTSSWFNHSTGATEIKPIKAGSLTVAGMELGKYRLEIWDPQSGKRMSSTTITTSQPMFEVPYPRSNHDLAIKLVKL